MDISFISEGNRLSGRLLIPNYISSSPAILFLHGSGKIDSRAGYHDWQDYLCLHGIASLYFDFRGCGASEGTFEEGSLSNRLIDAQAGLLFLLNQSFIDINRIGLIGGSMGGHVAVRLLEKNRSLRSLILVSAAAYSEEAEGKKLNHSFSSTIRKDENWKSSPVFKILFEANLPVLSIYSDKDTVIPKGVQKSYQRAISRNAESAVYRLENGKHALLNPQNSGENCVMKSIFKHSLSFFEKTICDKRLY